MIYIYIYFSIYRVNNGGTSGNVSDIELNQHGFSEYGGTSGNVLDVEVNQHGFS